MNLKFSIIVLSWNTQELLRNCLKSLTLTAESKRSEIIVVDNCSSDGSDGMVRKDFPLVRLIENDKNMGFAKGNNVGLKVARGRYIMLLNSDTVVHPGAIKKLVEYLENHPDTAVSPLLVLPDGRPQSDYYMCFPNLWQVLLYHHPILRPVVMNTPVKRLICRPPRSKPFEVDQLPGAALMASRHTWQKIGNLDPEFQFLWEDVDWSWRAKTAGVRRVVVPAAVVTHVGGGSWKKKLDRDKTGFYRQFFASLLLFVRKNYPAGRLVLFKAALAINFLTTGKFGLLADLIKGDLKQKKLWR